MSSTNSRSSVGLALLAGIAIGATVGILAAPDKGAKTRKKLKDGYDAAKDDLGTKFNAASEKFKSKISEMDSEGKYQNLVSDLSSKSEDVISFLENKLQALKNESAKYSANR